MPKLTTLKAGGELFNKLMKGAMKDKANGLIDGYDLKAYEGAFSDKDLVDTCLALFENDLNVSRTACELYMHRNTLIYRIAKIKRLTGLNVCAFSDAVTFLILYRCYCEGGR